MNLATLAEQNLTQYGEYDRLVFEGRTFTNRQLHEASMRLAGALVALGCAPSDRVILMMPNAPEVLVAYPAIWRAGLAVVPVLFVLEARELAYIVRNSAAKVIVTSPEVLPKVREALAELVQGADAEAATRARSATVIVSVGEVPDARANELSYDALVEASTPLAQAVPREDDDIATILYTSGTTGQPKGVVQTHKNLHANALNAYKSSASHDPEERVLLVLPLAHTFGLSVLVAGYLFGTRGVLMRWFDPENALALIEAHKITYMAGVPTMFVMMTMHPKADQYDTSSVRRWLVGAAPMPVSQLREFEEKFGGTMFVGYGLSEASPSVASEREDFPRKAGSTGRPLAGVEVKIVDDDGKTVPAGTVGEICARGDNISPGYYENPEATAEAFKGGWLFTGDMGYLDDEGYLFVVERKKDLIIRGGLNVYPKDVEEVLHRHPAVLEAAVVGVPDARLGEEVCAYVVPRPGETPTVEAMVAHCQANLAKYKTPRYVEFVSDLPRTSLGKIQKKEVRKLAIVRFGARAVDSAAS
ncbi:MAG TPA: long-chain-fatty-acid--CoA ligase [Polyangiaceae bacterium]|jgi:long-chain acyl-CoA synthetase|nr:long-chain-fatty-acid--CoA ligase [Polyangiaceae bacterium]